MIGFDIERHAYGDHAYPAQLVLQDVLTIHGSQFKSAALIVASPPCQEFSYMAMPWSIAKQKQRDYETGVLDVKQLTALFDACFRIQQEAIEAAGHHIPLVVENVRGAQKWVGRARWHFGSFYLWGDVPALMPLAVGRKNNGGSWFNIGSPGQKDTGRNPVHALARHKSAGETVGDNEIQAEIRDFCRDVPPALAEGVKGSDGYERDHPSAFGWKKPNTSSKSPARKAASAMIAKIPITLSRHIAKAWHPREAA